MSFDEICGTMNAPLPLNARGAKRTCYMVTHLKYAVYHIWHHVYSRSWTESSINGARNTRRNAHNKVQLANNRICVSIANGIVA